MTYHDYLRTPLIRRRFEIIDGVFELMSPAPDLRHQESVFELAIVMRSAAGRLGKVFVSPFDVVISRQPLRTRQPDICFVSRERMHFAKAQMEGGPDVVVEVLSPANRRKAVLEKLADYARIGVVECWMVNLEARTLEIWRVRAGRFVPAATFRKGQKVRSQVLPPFVLPAVVFPAR
jgi:Uma2 family endonuclease